MLNWNSLAPILPPLIHPPLSSVCSPPHPQSSAAGVLRCRRPKLQLVWKSMISASGSMPSCGMSSTLLVVRNHDSSCKLHSERKCVILQFRSFINVLCANIHFLQLHGCFSTFSLLFFSFPKWLLKRSDIWLHRAGTYPSKKKKKKSKEDAPAAAEAHRLVF